MWQLLTQNPEMRLMRESKDLASAKLTPTGTCHVYGTMAGRKSGGWQSHELGIWINPSLSMSSLRLRPTMPADLILHPTSIPYTIPGVVVSTLHPNPQTRRFTRQRKVMCWKPPPMPTPQCQLQLTAKSKAMLFTGSLYMLKPGPDNLNKKKSLFFVWRT